MTDPAPGPVYRTSPEVELVLLDRLPPGLRASLRRAHDGDLYGVLRPRSGSNGVPLRAVNRDTALLLFTLRQAGPIPSYARHGDPGRLERQVRALVLDGVLEVQDGDRFLSGPAAVREAPDGPLSSGTDAGAGERAPGTGGGDALARLSRRALLYAAALPSTDPGALALRLYVHNRVPLSPRWADRLPDAAAVLRYLGLERGAGPGWRGRHGEVAGWLTWVRTTEPGGGPAGAVGGAPGARGPVWKLYVSPRPDAVPAVMGALPGAILGCGAEQFKVGADAGGLLRPDKIVVHFRDFEGLAAAAEALDRELEELPVQGVPFSSQIDGAGLLSWGLDPPQPRPPGGVGRAAGARPEPAEASGGEAVPETPETLESPGAVSWRAWIAGRLGASLARAKREGRGPGRAAAYALERLRTEGVDVEDWTPSAALWEGR